jgi:hypothetical protein
MQKMDDEAACEQHGHHGEPPGRRADRPVRVDQEIEELVPELDRQHRHRRLRRRATPATLVGKIRVPQRKQQDRLDNQEQGVESCGEATHDSIERIAMRFGLAVFLLLLSFNLLGDGLRDALDPRHRA